MLRNRPTHKSAAMTASLGFEGGSWVCADHAEYTLMHVYYSNRRWAYSEPAADNAHFANPSFNPVEFDGIKMQTGLNSFVPTPKQWIEKTGAVGITSSAGRYGGTFADKDIAFEFASWE